LQNFFCSGSSTPAQLSPAGWIHPPEQLNGGGGGGDKTGGCDGGLMSSWHAQAHPVLV